MDCSTLVMFVTRVVTLEPDRYITLGTYFKADVYWIEE